MVSYRTRGVFSLSLSIEVIAVTLAFWLWLPISHGQLTYSLALHAQSYAVYNAMLVLGILAGSKASNILKDDFWHSSRNALRQCFYGFAFLFIFVIGSKDQTISRVFIFSLMPVVYVTLAVCNRFLPPFIAKRTFRGSHQERLILVGPSKKIPFLQSWIENKEHIGYTTVGILCDDSPAASIGGIKVLGGLDDIERTVQEWSVTQVVMVEFPLFSNVLSNCASVCERLGVKFVVFCDFETRFHHAVTMFEDEGLRFISLRQEPLEDPFNRFLKRALDIAISLPVIVLILPATTALVWIIQRIQSPGPVFYRQPRAGIGNQPFEILKYRTMRVHNTDRTVQAKEGDPRIYPLGHWLRKASIDELPQFWNVLMGDMSVVGPRPHLLEHNEQFARALHNYHVRAHVKPGITGLAQVKGFRGETRTQQDVVKRVKADIYYLENWSLSLDIWIVMQTYVQIFIPPKTAR
jgi:putative colanic acid biosynthesis UDP-glucose lipid carrier transferase